MIAFALFIHFLGNQVHAEVIQQEEQSQLVQKLMKARDPFKILASSIGSAGDVDELTSYSLDSLKLVGILTGPDKIRALVSTPDGKTVSVGRGMKIGSSSGVIKQIYDDRLVVQEKQKNELGKVTLIQTEIPLVAEENDLDQDDVQNKL